MGSSTRIGEDRGAESGVDAHGQSGPATTTGAPGSPTDAPAQRAETAEPAWLHGGRGQVAVRDLGSRFAVLGIWVLLAGLYIVLDGKLFFSTSTLQTIFDSQTDLVFLALALLCTLCVGEFVDLSVASIFGLSAVIIPVLAVNHGWNVWLASLVALGAGTFAGVVNGVLVVFLGISTIVVTLGMSTLLLGIALWMTNLSEVTGLPTSFQGWVNHTILGLPLGFYYGVAATLIFGYVLAFMPLGRHVRAVGSNQEVSRLAGVRVRRIRFGAFVIAGTLAAVAGILTSASIGGFDPNSSQTYLLPTFAAVFLGTAVLQPGRFNPLGAWIAVYFLETGIIGLELLGAASWVSDVFYGAVLVIAVALTTLIRRRRS